MICSEPQMPAAVLIGSNSDLFGSKLHATSHTKGPQRCGLFPCCPVSLRPAYFLRRDSTMPMLGARSPDPLASAARRCSQRCNISLCCESL